MMRRSVALAVLIAASRTASARMHERIRITFAARNRRSERPRVAGKFLFAGDEKLYVRGVTYGTFRPDAARRRVPDRATGRARLRAMAAHGINAVRIYTVPPRWLLDAGAASTACG